MKNRKALILALLLCAALVPVLSGCKGAATQKLSYTLSEDGTYYEAVAPREKNLTTEHITVPATYKDKPVGIGVRAFYGLPELVSVTVEGAVGKIEAQAFMNCPKLETVTLQGEAEVSNKCFNSCESLRSITFGAGITSIGVECVTDCPALQTLVIGDDCKKIATKAFRDCTSLESVTLGSGLESIGSYAFAYTTSLKSIKFPTETSLLLDSYAFSYSGLEELHIPSNIVMREYVFDHLAWDDVNAYSRCKAVYFYSTEPTVGNLGTNSIGYTWDRNEEDDAELGDFLVYVPEEQLEVYTELMLRQCDESWARCILNLDKLATFVPEDMQ